MAVVLKSKQQIAQLREAGRLVAETYMVLHESVVPGVTTGDLDRIAEEFIVRKGAKPAYKGYTPNARRIPPFPATICSSVNDVICHGIPSNKERLRQGDIIGVDIGLSLNGWVGDACFTYTIGAVDERTQKLVDTARHCLDLGIEQAQT